MVEWRSGRSAVFFFGGFGVLLLLAGIIGLLITQSKLRKATGVHDRLRKVTATMIESKMKVYSARRGYKVKHQASKTTYELKVRYRYSVDQKTYVSTRWRRFEAADDRKQYWEKMAKRYVPGSTVTAYYDPDEPSYAVLDPRVDKFLYNLLTAVFAGMMALGLILAIIIGIKHFRARPSSR